MGQPNIAIICDFDGTLGPDMISFLLSEYGIDPKRFWDDITRMVTDGWDPAQAYMHEILKRIPSLTKENLHQVGSKLPLFPGIPEVFSELKEFVQMHENLKAVPINIEYYIISGGLEEITPGCPETRMERGKRRSTT